MEWLESVKRKLASRQTAQIRSWDENGLHAVEGELSTNIVWSEVRRVYAYKKDCLTVDQIRLIVLTDQDGIEFTEDDRAFADLCALLNKRLGISDDWHLRLVTAPAFETTFTPVYPVGPEPPIRTNLSQLPERARCSATLI
jgi:hypothetical protein